MDARDALALDEAMADVLVQLRGLSDLAKGTAAKWNKLYNSSWHEAENLKHANHSCGGSQGCPLQNARCAAAAANLRYKSALNIAMTFMSFTLQGVHTLKANLTHVTRVLQELLAGNLQGGGDCFLEEYGAQVQQLLAKIEGLNLMVMAAINPQAVPVSADLEMRKYQFSQMSDVTIAEGEAVKRLQEQDMDLEGTPRKRTFDGSSMSMEGECRSFKHEDKRRKQR